MFGVYVRTMFGLCSVMFGRCSGLCSDYVRGLCSDYVRGLCSDYVRVDVRGLCSDYVRVDVRGLATLRGMGGMPLCDTWPISTRTRTSRTWASRLLDPDGAPLEDI